MNSTGRSLFAGLSLIAEMESPRERAQAIARDLLEAGMRRVEVRVSDQGREVAQAAAGTSPLRWSFDPRPAATRAVCAALSVFEEDGVSIAGKDLVKRLGPGFTLEGDPSGTSLLFFRLTAATRVVGLVLIDTGRAQPPDRETLAQLRSYCDVVATLFDRERNALRANREAERSDVLERIASHVWRALDRRTLLELAVGDVRDAFKSARCIVYERDKADPSQVHVVALDDAKAIQAPIPRTHTVVPGSILERIFEKGELVAVERVGDDPVHERARRHGVRALLAGPICGEGGQVEAALAIHFAREHSFDPVELVLLRAITAQLGLALANVRSHGKEQQARRRAEMLERNLLTLRGIRTLHEVLRSVCDTIVAEFGACGSAWSIFDGRFRCEAAAARKEAVLPSYAVGTSISMKPEQLDRLHEERVILTRDDPELWGEMASKQAMIVPLFIDRELWGVLVARVDLVPGETDDDRAKFLATLASHTALVIANARAFEEQRRFALERSVLSEAARLVLTFNDPESLASATTKLVLGLCGADRVEIHVPRDGELLRIGWASSSECDPEEGVPGLGPELLQRSLQTGGTLLENDGHMAVLALPSIDHVAGILACYRDIDDTAPFDPDDVRFLESFCGLLGLGLRNCALYEAESAANHALARSGEFKDDLLAMFTHDFKGPLTVIMGYTKLLIERTSGEVRRDLAKIYAQTERLVTLADDTMRLARAQATEYELQRAGTDLAEFVEEALGAMGSSRVELITPDQRPIRVSIDRARMRQVIDNLVGNALKYSSDRVLVKIELDLGEVRILITDRGIGVPQGDRERIFTRFGRASNARMRGISGFGVGLYTSRKIVEAHGGRISVVSDEGKGSTFTIALPTLVAIDRPLTAAVS